MLIKPALEHPFDIGVLVKATRNIFQRNIASPHSIVISGDSGKVINATCTTFRILWSNGDETVHTKYNEEGITIIDDYLTGEPQAVKENVCNCGNPADHVPGGIHCRI